MARIRYDPVNSYGYEVNINHNMYQICIVKCIKEGPLI